MPTQMFAITDLHNDAARSLTGRVAVHPTHIVVFFDGYAGPVKIYNVDGAPQVCIWDGPDTAAAAVVTQLAEKA